MAVGFYRDLGGLGFWFTGLPLYRWVGGAMATGGLLPLLASAMAVAQPIQANARLAQPLAQLPGIVDACQPPAPAEYLLLVVTRTPDSQMQVQQLLPPNTSVIFCNYLDEPVTRVGGFRTVERANAWARYIKETTGLAAYVARPAETSTATRPPDATPSPLPPSTSPKPPATTPPSASSTTNTDLAYSPKPLGSGYAVLVDYANQPEVAPKVQQAIAATEVGLVSYEQRPYLLALHTSDSAGANETLRTLKNRGFTATLVDSRRVVLLKSAVVLPRR
jgi:hypothetical protein